MAEKTFYDLDGRVVFSCSGNLDCIDLSDYRALASIDCFANSERQYIDDHVVVDKPTKPSRHHIFDYATKQWVDPRTPETEWPVVRADRDRRLVATDWTQLPDVPIATKEAWATYRQALRDITDQPDPFNIVWPTPPQ